MSINLKAVTSCMGYQQITNLTTAQNLTVPDIDPTTGLTQKPVLAFLISEGQAVRWRDDGVAPTATVGVPLPVDVPFPYDGDLEKIQFIELAGGAILNVSYYK